LISDILHALDQGISSHIIANIFVEVMDSRFELNICIDMYSWSSKKENNTKHTMFPSYHFSFRVFNLCCSFSFGMSTCFWNDIFQ
jgi:hypothetical protein